MRSHARRYDALLRLVKERGCGRRVRELCLRASVACRTPNSLPRSHVTSSRCRRCDAWRLVWSGGGTGGARGRSGRPGAHFGGRRVLHSVSDPTFELLVSPCNRRPLQLVFVPKFCVCIVADGLDPIIIFTLWQHSFPPYENSRL